MIDSASHPTHLNVLHQPDRRPGRLHASHFDPRTIKIYTHSMLGMTSRHGGSNVIYPSTGEGEPPIIVTSKALCRSAGVSRPKLTRSIFVRTCGKKDLSQSCVRLSICMIAINQDSEHLKPLKKRCCWVPHTGKAVQRALALENTHGRQKITW